MRYEFFFVLCCTLPEVWNVTPATIVDSSKLSLVQNAPFPAKYSIVLSLHSHLLHVEVAHTPQARACGLMGRTELHEGEGMLFVFEEPANLSFWMKDTSLPLSIAFFDEKKRLINKVDMEPMSLKTHRSEKPALYALEVPQGWYERHQVEIGDRLEFLEAGEKRRIR